MELLRLKCPACHSSEIQYHSSYTTKNYGGRALYKCEHCPASFSEQQSFSQVPVYTFGVDGQ